MLSFPLLFLLRFYSALEFWNCCGNESRDCIGCRTSNHVCYDELELEKGAAGGGAWSVDVG